MSEKEYTLEDRQRDWDNIFDLAIDELDHFYHTNEKRESKVENAEDIRVNLVSEKETDNKNTNNK